MSSYSGEIGLRQDIEVVVNKKTVVIKEFMQRMKEQTEVIIGDNPVLLVDSENCKYVTEVATTDLLGDL